MKNVNFRPWVGKKYFSEGFNNKKLLILGESHYCDSLLSDCGKCTPNQCSDFTNRVIKKYLNLHNGKDWLSTFLSFERNLFNRELSNKEACDFWNRVVFYNYIQFALPNNGVAPNSEFWAPSEIAFREILENYLPDKVIAWGVRLYDGLPDWSGHHSIIQVENYKTDVWEYTVNDKIIPVLKIQHPCSSYGKSRDKWHKLYNKFIEL